MSQLEIEKVSDEYNAQVSAANALFFLAATHTLGWLVTLIGG